MGMADACAVQAALCAAKLEAGRKIIGWKIGLTGKAMQHALNTDVPGSGVLFDDMLFENGATVPAGNFVALIRRPIIRRSRSVGSGSHGRSRYCT